MQKNKWIPIFASVGVGFATYYTMAKKNQKFSQAIQNIVPFVSSQLATNGDNNKNKQMNKVQAH